MALNQDEVGLAQSTMLGSILSDILLVSLSHSSPQPSFTP